MRVFRSSLMTIFLVAAQTVSAVPAMLTLCTDKNSGQSFLLDMNSWTQTEENFEEGYFENQDIIYKPMAMEGQSSNRFTFKLLNESFDTGVYKSVGIPNSLKAIGLFRMNYDSENDTDTFEWTSSSSPSFRMKGTCDTNPELIKASVYSQDL